MLLVASLNVGGCVAAKPDLIPRYAKTAAAASLARLSGRLAGLKSVRGEATVILTDAKEQTVRLDAAFAFAPPDRARLRAWKFGQAVFDLTLHGGDAWAYLPRDEAKPAAPNLRQSLARWLGLLYGGPDAFAGDRTIETDTRLRITRAVENGQTLSIDIDRPTLTVRRYAISDAHGVERFSLALSDYRPAADGQVWPMTIVATSEGGVFEVRARDVEVNGELDPDTFRPPARADKLP